MNDQQYDAIGLPRSMSKQAVPGRCQSVSRRSFKPSLELLESRVVPAGNLVGDTFTLVSDAVVNPQAVQQDIKNVQADISAIQAAATSPGAKVGVGISLSVAGSIALLGAGISFGKIPVPATAALTALGSAALAEGLVLSQQGFTAGAQQQLQNLFPLNNSLPSPTLALNSDPDNDGDIDMY
jgi:hypothetical protein